MKILGHAHTTFSRDGALTPTELASLAANHGFGAVLLSDHYEHLDRPRFEVLVRNCAEASSCLMVPGYERSWSGFHLCAFGIDSWIGGNDLQTWTDEVRAHGGIVCLAHPARYEFSAPDEILAACDAIEVWNSKRPYDGGLVPNPAAWRLLGSRRLAFAGQDFHRRLDLTSVGMELADTSQPDELMSELRKGRFTIRSRWLRLGRTPPTRAKSMTLWQRIRPSLWAGPIWAARSVRRLKRSKRWA